jgi:hypothetical protein
MGFESSLRKPGRKFIVSVGHICITIMLAFKHTRWRVDTLPERMIVAERLQLGHTVTVRVMLSSTMCR